MIVENSDQNIPIPFHSVSHYGTNESIGQLSIQIRQSKYNIKLPKLHIYQITSQLKARSDTLNQLHVTTQQDDELKLMKHTIANG